MVKSKKHILVISKLILISYLVVFPLGQLTKIIVGGISVNLSDIIVFPTLFLVMSSKIKKPVITKHFLTFFFICLFSLLLSLSFFTTKEIFVNGLYLLRLLSYFTFYITVWNLINTGKIKRSGIINSLLIASLAVAILGWFQYILYPNLTVLKYLGWDDHYYRLVSTFFDPTFTGLILVFGVLIFLSEFMTKNRFSDLFALAFLTISILYTYSRSSYISLIVASTYLLFKHKLFKIKNNLIYLVAGILIVVFIFLPKNIGEGTNLLRTQSIKSKISSYHESAVLIKESPLFGFGFNNTCSVRYKYFETDSLSHGCAGVDSSILFIFVTTGLIGFMAFVGLTLKTYENLRNDYFADTYKSIFIAVLIHSFFANSMFYPFILAFLMLFLAVSTKDSGEFKGNK